MQKRIMIRAVRLNNFVKIEDDYLLTFPQDGAYFFVGENGTGKSSIFEAIRRCLSRESNNSFSRVPDKFKPTYIICEYEIPERARPSFSNSKKLFTSFLRLPDSRNFDIKLKYQYVKIVLLGNDDISQNGKVFIELIERENQSHNLKHCTCMLQTEEEIKLKDEILNELPHCTNESNDSKEHVKSLLKCMDILIAKRNNTEDRATQDREHETTDTILRQLDDNVVFTFGLRSLGRVQWSKSPLVAIRHREDNYKSASDRCEIIKYFLSDEKSEKYEIQKANEIFRILTDGADYTFEIKETGVSAQLNGEPVEVLKISEGILEAKYLSLLLTSKEFVTVFLEEPDKGMHPQMIQRIRDIVLLQVIEKTIIIVSHNPIFIAPWSIPRTYKFYKEQSEGHWIHKMVDVGKVAKNDKNKIPRLLASEDYASMLFARRVIFVEGQSDVLFVKAFIAHILNPSKDYSTKKVLKLALSEDQSNIPEPSTSEQATHISSRQSIEDILTEVRTFLASLHVVKLSGEKSKLKLHNLCKELRLSRLFLLDRDAVVKVQFIDACNRTSDVVKCNIKRLIKEDYPQDDKKVKHLKTDVSEDVAEDSIIYKRMGDQRKKSLSIPDAEKKMKEVIQAIRCRTKSPDKVEDELNEEPYNKVYHQYFSAIYNDLLSSTFVPVPLSTVVMPKDKQCIVSPIQQDNFQKSVNRNEWENARKCLENDGVFVWRHGDLEDAFVDLVTNFEWNDSDTRDEELLRRHMSFAQLGIYLNLSKGSTKTQTKLYMDDKVSDEDISKSIVAAFNLCSEKSDITQLLRFLVMCIRGEVTLTPWTKETC